MHKNVWKVSIYCVVKQNSKQKMMNATWSVKENLKNIYVLLYIPFKSLKINSKSKNAWKCLKFE